MALEIIVPIVVGILVIVVGWSLFKKVTGLLLYAGIALILLLAATSFFIYQDMVDLKKNFAGSTKKVILVDEDKVLTGFLLNGEIGYLTNKELVEFSSYLENNDYKKILGNSYKLMVFDLDIVSGLEEIETEDETISSQDAISTLKSDNSPKDKAELFGAILNNEILSSSTLFFFSEFKKGNILIYPETALFKTAKITPLALIKDTGKNIFTKTKEKAKTLVVEETE
jgi:hypothetical protein